MTKDVVNNNIKELLTQNGMSQTDLAVKLNLSRQHINNLITGKTNASVKTALQIGRIFNKPVEEIFID